MLNEHFAILVKHMVNRSILTIWYSFATADSIEDELKTNGHSTCRCIRQGHGEVPVQKCTLEVVLSLFNVLNEHFAILVNYMANRSIFTIWYSFTIAESIEDKLKTNGHSTYPCIRHGHREVPVQKSRGNNCEAVTVTGNYPCRSHGEITVQQSRSRGIR